MHEILLIKSYSPRIMIHDNGHARDQGPGKGQTDSLDDLVHCLDVWVLLRGQLSVPTGKETTRFPATDRGIRTGIRTMIELNTFWSTSKPIRFEYICFGPFPSQPKASWLHIRSSTSSAKFARGCYIINLCLASYSIFEIVQTTPRYHNPAGGLHFCNPKKPRQNKAYWNNKVSVSAWQAWSHNNLLDSSNISHRKCSLVWS